MSLGYPHGRYNEDPALLRLPWLRGRRCGRVHRLGGDRRHPVRCEPRKAAPGGAGTRWLVDRACVRRLRMRDVQRDQVRVPPACQENERILMNFDDHPLPEDDEIKAAFPTRSGRHDLYQEAMRLVGAKHSKFAFVELVNWLLHRVE